MHRRSLLATTLLSVAALGFTQAAHAATEVRYGLWAEKGEAQYEGAQKFKEVVEELSDGRFEVKIFPGNQLGTPREMLAQLALDDTQICASGDPGIKEIEYLALPYLMNGIANYSAVIDSDIGEQWNDKLVDERQIRLLGFLPRSPRQISTNKPINTMADLEGLKLRSPERDYYVELLTALGAKPTPMAFSEVYTALQTGVVDGQENPIETIYASKFYEVQDAVAMVDYIDKPAYVMFGEPFWSSLSDEDRAIFQQAQAEFAQAGRGDAAGPGEGLHRQDEGGGRHLHLSRTRPSSSRRPSRFATSSAPRSGARSCTSGSSRSASRTCPERGPGLRSRPPHAAGGPAYSTVTDLARLRGWSTSVPLSTAV